MDPRRATAVVLAALAPAALASVTVLTPATSAPVATQPGARPAAGAACSASCVDGRRHMLRRAALVGDGARLVIAARDTQPADRCVNNGERRAVRVSIALRGAGSRVAVSGLRVLVDGRLQAAAGRRGAARILRRGALHWQTRTRDGLPFMVAGRHTGSIEIVTTASRRTRLSLSFYVCM